MIQFDLVAGQAVFMIKSPLECYLPRSKARFNMWRIGHLLSECFICDLHLFFPGGQECRSMYTYLLLDLGPVIFGDTVEPHFVCWLLRNVRLISFRPHVCKTCINLTYNEPTRWILFIYMLIWYISETKISQIEQCAEGERASRCLLKLRWKNKGRRNCV